MSARDLGGSAGSSPIRGGGKAAPYGRKPTGRGTAAGPAAPHPQLGGSRRYAAAVTARTQA